MKTARKKTKPLTAACECVKQVNVQLAKKNAKLRWVMMFNFTTMKASESPPMLMVQKIDSDKKKPLPTLFCSYCPFCGRKLK